MPTVYVHTPHQIANVALAEMQKVLSEARLDELVLSQCKRRMDQGGDSEITYPRLWADGVNSYRSGGQPLLDTRQNIYNRLNASQEVEGRGVTVTVRSSLVGVFHHFGFKTKGPNFIPLSLRARRLHLKGNDPANEGLVRGVDYIMAWRGVTVPPRPIFRVAPEDMDEIEFQIAYTARQHFRDN